MPDECDPILLNPDDPLSGHPDDYGLRCGRIREKWRSTQYLVWWVSSNSDHAGAVVDQIGKTATIDNAFRGTPVYLQYALARAQEAANGTRPAVWYMENVTCARTNSTLPCLENSEYFGIPIVSQLTPTLPSERSPRAKRALTTTATTATTASTPRPRVYVTVVRNHTDAPRLVDEKVRFGVVLVPKLWEQDIVTCLADSNADNPCKTHAKSANTHMPVAQVHLNVWTTTHDCQTSPTDNAGNYLHRKEYTRCDSDCRGELKQCDVLLETCVPVQEGNIHPICLLVDCF